MVSTQPKAMNTQQIHSSAMHPKDPIEGIVVAGKESPERHEGLRRTGWEGRDPRKGRAGQVNLSQRHEKLTESSTDAPSDLLTASA